MTKKQGTPKSAGGPTSKKLAPSKPIVPNVDPRLAEEPTTMPVLEAAAPGLKDDPRRSFPGPPKEPVQKVRQTVGQIPLAGMYLMDQLTGDDARKDAAEWFPDATEYVERTAEIPPLTTFGLPETVPYGGEHLLARNDRIKELGRLETVLAKYALMVRYTRLREQRDLMRMCDIRVEEAQLQERRPTIDMQTRQALSGVLELPLSLWARRQAAIQEARRHNERDAAALKAEQDHVAELEQALAEGQTTTSTDRSRGPR